MREEASARKESSVRELVSTHERPRGEVRLRLLVREPAVPAAARLCVSVCLSPYTAVCERGGGLHFELHQRAKDGSECEQRKRRERDGGRGRTMSMSLWPLKSDAHAMNEFLRGSLHLSRYPSARTAEMHLLMMLVIESQSGPAARLARHVSLLHIHSTQARNAY